jgi:hypothetical protein
LNRQELKVGATTLLQTISEAALETECLKTLNLIGACLVLDSLGENSDQREEIERMKEKEASRFCC